MSEPADFKQGSLATPCQYENKVLHQHEFFGDFLTASYSFTNAD